MTRVLLAEHSPHAQRMGERILREEGFSVVTVTSGESAMLRLGDVKPEFVLADVSLGDFSGYRICDHIKTSPDHVGTGVVLTLGALEALDEEEAKRVRADGVLRKPFEASALLAAVSKFAKPQTVIGVVQDRTDVEERAMRPARAVIVLDPEQVRAAVTIALDEAFEPLIERVTDRVLKAISSRK
jgi:CheY-like chemotaxis protein